MAKAALRAYFARITFAELAEAMQRLTVDHRQPMTAEQREAQRKNTKRLWTREKRAKAAATTSAIFAKRTRGQHAVS